MGNKSVGKIIFLTFLLLSAIFSNNLEAAKQVTPEDYNLKVTSPPGWISVALERFPFLGDWDFIKGWIKDTPQGKSCIYVLGSKIGYRYKPKEIFFTYQDVVPAAVDGMESLKAKIVEAGGKGGFGWVSAVGKGDGLHLGMGGKGGIATRETRAIRINGVDLIEFVLSSPQLAYKTVLPDFEKLLSSVEFTKTPKESNVWGSASGESLPDESPKEEITEEKPLQESEQFLKKSSLIQYIEQQFKPDEKASRPVLQIKIENLYGEDVKEAQPLIGELSQLPLKKLDSTITLTFEGEYSLEDLKELVEKIPEIAGLGTISIIEWTKMEKKEEKVKEEEKGEKTKEGEKKE